MPETQKDLVILLRAVSYEERHRIVTGLSETQGKISAMARNAIQSRRFGGCLETFTASDWTFSKREGSDLAHLQETQIRKSFDGLKQNFEALSMASVFNELMIRLAPEFESCGDLFKLHSNALTALEELATQSQDTTFEKNLIGILNSYLAKVLQWNGTQPRLLRCYGCEKSLLDFNIETSMRVHISVAAWTCPDCKNAKPDQFENYAPGFQHRFLTTKPTSLGDFALALTQPIRKIPTVLLGTLEEQLSLFVILESLLIYHVPGFDRAALKGLRFIPSIEPLQFTDKFDQPPRTNPRPPSPAQEETL